MPSKLKKKGGAKKKVAKGVKKPATPKRTTYKRAAKQERFVANPVLPCDLKKKIKSRKDAKRLEAHLNAIEAHRQLYENRLKQAQAKLAKGDASEQQAIPAHKAKVTEAKGEYEATVLMIENYVKSKGGSDFELLWGFSAGTGIDQVWVAGKPPHTYVIVEAKGPGATLSTNAAKGDQMSKQWVRASLESVVNSSKSGQTDIDHAQRMLDAMDGGPPPQVLGRVIEAEPNGGAKEIGCPDKGIYHKTK